MSWRRLFGLCDHKWMIQDEARLLCRNRVIGKMYMLRCSKCGYMKVKTCEV